MKALRQEAVQTCREYISRAGSSSACAGLPAMNGRCELPERIAHWNCCHTGIVHGLSVKHVGFWIGPLIMSPFSAMLFNDSIG